MHCLAVAALCCVGESEPEQPPSAAPVPPRGCFLALDHFLADCLLPAACSSPCSPVFSMAAFCLQLLIAPSPGPPRLVLVLFS